jgi:hypothetical protein
MMDWIKDEAFGRCAAIAAVASSAFMVIAVLPG